MHPTDIVDLLQRSLLLTLLVVAPAALTAAAVGFVVAIIQATTQIQDQSISQSMKLIIVLALLLLIGSWMGRQIFKFADDLTRNFPMMVKSGPVDGDSVARTRERPQLRNNDVDGRK